MNIQGGEEYFPQNKKRKTVDPSQSLFWDAVIISASDSSQEKGYELQILEKQQKGELPLSIPFHIFADPPGYKIGMFPITFFN
ncbi:hypothetical protein TNCV_179061 [Trichonephila clavipes]|nr:hypothetical protein TNCV_179061 [Trichonephila clavipes]